MAIKLIYIDFTASYVVVGGNYPSQLGQILVSPMADSAVLVFITNPLSFAFIGVFPISDALQWMKL